MFVSHTTNEVNKVLFKVQPRWPPWRHVEPWIKSLLVRVFALAMHLPHKTSKEEWLAFLFKVYIAEISPAKYRGALGSGNQLSISLGTLIAYSLGAWFRRFRWLAIAGAVPPTLMIVLMAAMPETPRWLVKNDRMPEAIQVMKWLRGESQEDCEEECQDIVRSTFGKFSLD